MKASNSRHRCVADFGVGSQRALATCLVIYDRMRIGEELVDIAGEFRAFGGGKACSVPDLARADLAES